MEERRYIISDASKLVEVESHVLRYWEDELGVTIPRNEMGHRYYTDFYINLFKKVKELKDGGFQLKAIKMLVPELMEMHTNSGENVNVLKEELFLRLTDMPENTVEYEGDAISGVSSENIVGKLENELDNKVEEKQITVNGNKLEQFQNIISEVVSNALKENNNSLGREVSEIVSDNVIKEMDYLMHIREKQEEERFKKLDETIRNFQVAGRERAKVKKGIFSKIKRL